jgi:hypothetical protein
MKMILKFANGQSTFVAPQPALTEQQAWDNMDREIQQAYNELEVKQRIELEANVRAFIERTGLPEADVVMVRFPSGAIEPQWRGVLPPQALFAAGPCPDCGGQH